MECFFFFCGLGRSAGTWAGWSACGLRDLPLEKRLPEGEGIAGAQVLSRSDPVKRAEIQHDCWRRKLLILGLRGEEVLTEAA